MIYQGPLVAPVDAGMEVGTLRIWSGDRLIQEAPLHTSAAVARGSLPSRAVDALSELTFGWIGKPVRARARFITLEGGEGQGNGLMPPTWRIG